MSSTAAVQITPTPLEVTSVPTFERLDFKFRDWNLSGWSSVPFVLIHVLVLVGLFVWPWSYSIAFSILGFYFIGMFSVTAGYHRYFSHRTFKTSRVFQFVMAFFAQATGQKGVLWWAAHHRRHHRHSDLPTDIHSPVRKGFWWSHMGWILSDDYRKT